MNLKIRHWFAGAAVLCVALLTWWSLAMDPGSPSLAGALASGSGEEVTTPIERVSDPEPAAREEVKAPSVSAPDAADDVPFDPSPVKVTPWLARFLVVDEDEQPVPDAVVTVWAAKRMRPHPSMSKAFAQQGNPYAGRESVPLLELHTDVSGRTQAWLELEVVVAAASKTDIGRAIEQMLGHKVAADTERKFILEMLITLRGVVLRTDGLPAAGATVSARPGFNSLRGGMALEPERVATSVDGRFELLVSMNSHYGVSAELDGAKTFTERAWVRTPKPPEVVLRFPGGITLAGIVVDVEGKPVAKAKVMGWREYHIDDPKQDIDDFERAEATSGDDGRFSIAVRKHARYQLVANADGHPSSNLCWVETTVERPHAEARLELPAYATIRGRVVRGDGSPFVGVRVGARAESGYSGGAIAVPGRDTLFGQVTPVTTDADGGFALTVHPSTTWTVSAAPKTANQRVSVRQSGIAPGRADVLLSFSEAELAGCVVRGTVVRSDGQPLGPYLVEIVHYEDGKTFSSSDGNATIDGERFSLPPLSLGRQFALRVSPREGDSPRWNLSDPLAPTQIAPFTTDQPELNFEFRLEPWGEVPVRVLDAAGAPARRVNVAIVRDVNLGFWPTPPQVDADGRAVVKRCAPGPHHVRVFVGDEVLVERELLVTPGLNPEVELRLPALTPHKDR